MQANERILWFSPWENCTKSAVVSCTSLTTGVNCIRKRFIVLSPPRTSHTPARICYRIDLPCLLMLQPIGMLWVNLEEISKGSVNLGFRSYAAAWFKNPIQRTLTVGGRITVRLVSSLTRLELTNEGNIILFVLSEAV